MAKVIVEATKFELSGGLKEDVQKAAERIFTDGLFLNLEGTLVKVRVELEENE